MNVRIAINHCRYLVAGFALIVITGCSESPLRALPTPGIPFVHKIDVQQGNVVTQEMVAQLRLGMDKKKVRYVMGTPIIQDTFHSSRWDYLYTFHEGGGSTERRLVTAVFNEDGRLISIEGDVKPALGKLVVDKHQDTSVNVPGEYKKPLLVRLKDSMPFTGDEDEDDAAEDADEEAGDAETVAEGDADDGELMAEAATESVTVPEGEAPKKKKGFFRRIVDSVGLGPDDDAPAADDDKKDDRRYRDPTDPDMELP